MLTVALAQLKTHARRFIAVGLAVIMAVAFLGATLMVNASTEASIGNTVGAGYKNADLVVRAGPEETLGDDALAAVQQAGPAGVYAQSLTYVAFTAEGGNGQGVLSNTAPAGLDPLTVLSGVLPTVRGEIALDEVTAGKYELAVGSLVGVSGEEAAAEGPEQSPAPGVQLRVSGLVKASKDPFLAGMSQLYAVPATAAGFAAATAGGPSYASIQLDAAGQVTALQESVRASLAAAGFPAATVNTAAEETTARVASFTGGTDQLTIVLLAFAAVALLVAGLVVSNTFSVLIAQRTRELALLRCIGADRGQVRRSVLVEALLVGVVSSAAGVLLAIGLMAAVIAWLQTRPETEFAALAVRPSAIIVSLVVGVLLTVLAALAPARAATAVAPLAALRPSIEATVRNRRGRLRLALGLLLVAGGGTLLMLGTVSAQLLLALPGGALSFVGLILCTPLFVPPLVSGFGALARPLGVPGKLAAVNAVRNPGRTASTASALLIGVTLVAMMMTGAATARSAFDNELAGQYPVDLTVGGTTLDGRELDDAAAAAAGRVPGILDAALVTLGGWTEVRGSTAAAYQLTPEQAAAVLQDEALTLDAGTILMPEGTKESTVQVSGTKGQATLTVVVAGDYYFPPVISAATADRIGAPAAPAADSENYYDALPQLWLAVDRELGTNELLDLRTDLATALQLEDYQVSGAAIERASFNQVIDVLLLVVLGLLGIAVLIALVGVANTLSLSVLERTQESSLLRALGLTRGQLRGMLALEAVLMAGVAALIGTVLGVVYGWAGAQSALGSFTAVSVQIPWAQLAGVLAVAVLAGLLASVIPARRAALLSPVEGLAAD